MTLMKLILGAAALLSLGAAAAWPQEATRQAGPPEAGLAVATFAGGCFWCMEPPFDKLDGVVSTTSGYTGGTKAGATYRQVTAGGTGHKEAVRVVYDPTRIGYAALLDVYWHNIDPVDAKGQFCDKGESYRPVIFVADATQTRLAEASLAAMAASGRFDEPLAVSIEPAREFWIAEDYHQDFYEKNPVRYKFYRWNCGRDARLQAVWGAAAEH